MNQFTLLLFSIGLVGANEYATVDETILKEFTPLSNLHEINMTTNIDQHQYAQLTNNAELGDSMSNYFLGLTHLYGLGKQPADSVKASRFFRLSAEAGNMDAACALGLLLYLGTGGVGRDSSASAAWLKMASLQDHPRGHWLLGRAYYEGRVINDDGRYDPDHDEAGRLFGLAAEAGIPEAIHHLALSYEYGLIDSGEEVSEEVYNEAKANRKTRHLPNFRKAAELYKEAWVNFNFAESGYNLGLMIAYERGQEQNYVEAQNIFRSCSMQNHAGCTRYLGIFATHGHGMENDISDYKAALMWFDKCAKLEDTTVSPQCEREREELMEVVKMTREKLEKLTQDNPDVYGNLDLMYEINERML